MPKSMVQLRIPGLDHSLSEDGSWIPTPNYYHRLEREQKHKRMVSKARKRQQAQQSASQISIWNDMAPR